MRGRQATSEANVDRGPAVANHDLGNEPAQAIGIARHERVLLRDVLLLEAAEGVELPWPEQRDEVVEFNEVVLDGRGGEQEQVAAGERLDELPSDRVAVAQVVRLVDDDEVVALLGDGVGVRRAFCRREGGDGAGIVAPVESGAGDGEVEPELFPQLIRPLVEEDRRDKDEDATGEAAQHELKRDEPCLDRLAEADLVAEQDTAAVTGKRGVCGGNLMAERDDGAAGVRRQQPIEAGHDRQSLRERVQLVERERLELASVEPGEQVYFPLTRRCALHSLSPKPPARILRTTRAGNLSASTPAQLQSYRRDVDAILQQVQTHAELVRRRR